MYCAAPKILNTIFVFIIFGGTQVDCCQTAVLPQHLSECCLSATFCLTYVSYKVSNAVSVFLILKGKNQNGAVNG